ncbi:MBL fold metallo-hydrolase [Lacrimispora sp. JR3]|uniref:MBL fold metallo-hydrolase n=1 Tax=Lacrimispora sinapis TaxID=3111456 RepID=UPI0037498917
MAVIEQIRCGSVNSYLIEERGRAILVDTGRKGFEEKILNVCRRTKVELILLTHGHFDHVQNTAYLAHKLDVPVAMHQADLSLLKADFPEPVSYQGFLGMLVAEVSAKSVDKDKIPVFTPEIYVREGDSLKAYGINARVLELPGHTRGSIGLDVEETAVIAGDALMNLFYPGLSMIYWDRDRMIESAQKISALGARKIYFGHGNPVENQEWGRIGI